MNFATNSNESKPSISGATYKAITFDRRLSHGAFRLWHVLRDYAGGKLKCWPGQRRLTKDMGSNFETIAGWRDELIQTGWLKVGPGSRRGHVYELLPLPTATESGSTHKNSTATGSGSAVLPEAVAPTATESGSETKTNKLNTIKGIVPAPYPSQLPALIRDQKAKIAQQPENDALWHRLWDLETHLHGAPCTKPKPQKIAAHQPDGRINIWRDLTEFDREEMMRQLRDAANQPNGGPGNPRLFGQADTAEAKRKSVAEALGE